MSVSVMKLKPFLRPLGQLTDVGHVAQAPHIMVKNTSLSMDQLRGPTVYLIWKRDLYKEIERSGKQPQTKTVNLLIYNIPS